MRRSILLLVSLWLLALGCVRAEIQVSVECERSNYLIYSAVPLRVIVQNNTEIDLALGNEGSEPWLTFLVTRADGFAVHTDQKLQVPPVVVKAGSSKSVTINITPYYSFREPGNYKVCAAVDIPGQGQQLSGRLMFNISRGQTLLTRTRPVEGSERSYTLVRFSPDNTTTELYLRVDDVKENLIYSMLDLGPITATVTPPQINFDKEGNLHILHTVGQGSYRYNRVTPGGQLEHQGNYEAPVEFPPKLASADDGNIMVVGGQVLDDENRRERLSEAKFNATSSKGSKTPAAQTDAKNGTPATATKSQ